ncbi:MAG TPA: hypothetical protein VH144_02465, partial [Candidatus Saccharimonadales bacterium]|nr:hypothetical protein [Candidatus Saccharimonadales bacterium]
SGSCKSTVAKELRARAKTKTALVEQDYLRRIVLKEHWTVDKANAELIFQVAKFALADGYDVIVEGILKASRHRATIQRLLEFHPENNHLYYFDISFEETLNRHMTKSNAHEFGEKEMRECYRPYDVLDLKNEQIIAADSSFEQTVDRILGDSQL